MNLKTAIASLLVGTAAWSNGVEGFNVPSGAAVGSVRAVETNSAGSNSNSNSYSNLLAQIDDANPYAQNLKSKLSMVAGGAQAEEYYEGKFVDKYFQWAKDRWDEVVAMRMNSPSGSSTSSVPHVPLFCRNCWKGRGPLVSRRRTAKSFTKVLWKNIVWWEVLEGKRASPMPTTTLACDGAQLPRCKIC